MTSKTTIQKEQYKNFQAQLLVDTLFGQFTNNFLNKSRREIQDEYGTHCAQIFSLLFVKYQRGGRTLEGKAYKTQWRLDEVAAAKFQLIHREFMYLEPTGKDILDAMLSKGFEPQERLKYYKGDTWVFDAKIVKGFNKIKSEKASLKEASKERRQKFSELKQIRESLYDEQPQVVEVNSDFDISTLYSK